VVNFTVNLLIVFALDEYFDGTVLKIWYLLLIKKISRHLNKDQSNDISEINGFVF
jgi:hypothetical protein